MYQVSVVGITRAGYRSTGQREIAQPSRVEDARDCLRYFGRFETIEDYKVVDVYRYDKVVDAERNKTVNTLVRTLVKDWDNKENESSFSPDDLVYGEQ